LTFDGETLSAVQEALSQPEMVGLAVWRSA
jgi:hypothetical protein